MKYSYRDVKNTIPYMKAKRDSLWCKCGIRQLSYLLAACCLNLGLTPNMISVISILDAVAAAVLLSCNNMVCIISGFICLILFALFDCIDGNMARTLKRASYMGEFYDAIGGYTMCAFTLFGGGICAYNTARVFFAKNLFLLVLLSALGSICDIFSRLVYQKYTANEMIANYKMGKAITRENDSFYNKKGKRSFSDLRMIIDRQFGITGFYPLIFVLSFWLSWLDTVIIVYSAYHIAALIAVIFAFCKKATEFDQREKSS